MIELINKRVSDITSTFASSLRNGMLNNIGSKVLETPAGFKHELLDNTLWLYVNDMEGAQHSIDIPLPFTENGVLLIKHNDVKRSLGNHLLEPAGEILDYLSIISKIIFEVCPEFIPQYLQKQVPFIYQLATGVKWGTVAITIKNLQSTINNLINDYPLHETYMNSFAMNQRLIIVDPEFIGSNPKVRHAYQMAKADKYFPKGWSTMGLSDGVLSSKNYILTVDLRRLTPFGLSYHNPQRNLYSTLGMRGDESPLIMTDSNKYLADHGITRSGWNLFTVFVDIPDVWEDQLMMDISHANKSVTYNKRYQLFGTLSVKQGDSLKVGAVLSVATDGEVTTFKEIADKAVVSEINNIVTNVGGKKVPSFSVIVALTRKLKDGVKLTNLSANKGVIRLKDLGYAVDPRTGEKRKIDVIVSSRAVQKRKNYGQVIEALSNNLNDEKPTIVADNVTVDIAALPAALKEKGFKEDGTWECDTYAGKFNCVAGKVFWGVTHDVEDMLWTKADTNMTNGRGLRTAGLKFSTVELRALTTRFGKDNAIVDEVMSYAQGADDLQEKLDILKAKRGELPEGKYVVPFSKVLPVDVSKSTIVPKENIVGTVVDENFYKEGFVLQLPITFEVRIQENGEIAYEGGPLPSEVAAAAGQIVVQSDKIYIPSAPLRKSWRHDTGNYGLSDTATLINNVLLLSYRYTAAPTVDINHKLLMNSIFAYFGRTALSLSTKKGDLSVYGMAVRYPFSAKAVATLSNSLPKNTIEIHRSMADVLEVNNDDIVLVERFPCLGFMSIRPQKVKITDDELCRYTIRASGNSLGSLGLDFDGDVIYLASFHTPEAKEALRREWTNPNKTCYDNISLLNNKMGRPSTKAYSLQDYAIKAFAPLTMESHNDIVDKATGVKSYTGPVISLAYNIMRIMENSEVKDDQKTNCAVEMFLDRVANSIFKQKHGAVPLRDIVVDAVCTADIETLVQHGFERSTSTMICDTIKKKALLRGVTNLVEHHEFIKANNRSNIINTIMRNENLVYFASRSALEPCELLYHLEQEVVDIPSKLLAWIMSVKSENVRNILTIRKEEAPFKAIKNHAFREAGQELAQYVEDLLTANVTAKENTLPTEEEIGELVATTKTFLRSINYGKREINNALHGHINK